MSLRTTWYCGHCSYGPMLLANYEHSCLCFRQRDAIATPETCKMSTHHSEAWAPTADVGDRVTESMDVPPSTALEVVGPPVAAKGRCQEVSFKERSYGTRDATDPVFPNTPVYSWTSLTDANPPQTRWYCCKCEPPNSKSGRIR